MRGIKEQKVKIAQWREKAKQRSLENICLRKRQKELEQSRALWKQKYQAQKRENEVLSKRCARLEKCLSRREDHTGALPVGHQYSSLVICLAIWIRQQGNCSLRSCARILAGLSVMLELGLGRPSHSSISNWEKKLGYYRLEQCPGQEEEWVIFVDESVSVGKQKLLLILGLSLDRYKFGKAPDFSDTVVLYIGIQASWKGAEIAQVIKGLVQRGLRIGYGISDQGNNIRKALKDSKLIQVPDCTHSLSKLIEKRYKKDAGFQAFSKACTDFKRRVILSDMAVYMSPVQRSKGRFLNLQPISEWAYKMLHLVKKWENDPNYSKAYEQTKWLLEFEELIVQMYQCCQTMNKIFKIIKTQGLSQSIKQACEQELESSLAPQAFCEGIRNYLIQVMKCLPERQTILCNGDIIESYFGKFKNRLSSNPNIGMTDSCLTIANFSQNFDSTQVKQAMEEVKIVQLKEWKTQNVPINKAQLRRKIFKNVG